jgi:hypothetical protein
MTSAGVSLEASDDRPTAERQVGQPHQHRNAQALAAAALGEAQVEHGIAATVDVREIVDDGRASVSPSR